MLYRIFVADMGKFRDSKNYRFVAEFAEANIADNYVRYMRGKERYAQMDIVVKKISGNSCDPSEGKVARVINVLGESLSVAEYEFL